MRPPQPRVSRNEVWQCCTTSRRWARNSFGCTFSAEHHRFRSRPQLHHLGPATPSVTLALAPEPFSQQGNTWKHSDISDIKKVRTKSRYSRNIRFITSVITTAPDAEQRKRAAEQQHKKKSRLQRHSAVKSLQQASVGGASTHPSGKIGSSMWMSRFSRAHTQSGKPHLTASLLTRENLRIFS